MEENQATESVDSSEQSSTDSSQSQVAQDSAQSTGTSESASSAASKDEYANVPFHLHPRFQEVVSQRNEFKTQMAESQRNYEKQLYDMKLQMQQLSGRLPEPKPQQHPVFDKLKDIDQDFANYLRGLEEKVAGFEKYGQKFQQYDQRFEMEQTRNIEQQAENSLDGLYKQNNVPDFMKQFIRDGIEANLIRMEANGKKPMLSDLPKYFNSAYEQTKKTLEEYKRSNLQSYVTDKKKDAVPASQTGGAPVSASKAQKPMTKAEMVQYLAKEMRAAKQSV